MIHMFMNQEKHYIIKAQNNFLRWSETKVLASLNSESIVKFLWKKIICWHEYFQKLICDEESENKNVIKILVKKYKIHQIIISFYNLQANEMIEINHKSIVNALSKLIIKETLIKMNE